MQPEHPSPKKDPVDHTIAKIWRAIPVHGSPVKVATIARNAKLPEQTVRTILVLMETNNYQERGPKRPERVQSRPGDTYCRAPKKEEEETSGAA